MEGCYTDYEIPPLTEFPSQTLIRHGHTFNTINETGAPSSSKINQKKKPSQRINNLTKEKKRRVKLTEYFSVLQSMVVPNRIPRIPQEALVNRTIERIQLMEKEVARLEELKMKKDLFMVSPELMEAKPVISRCTNRSSTIEVNVHGGLTFFGINMSAANRGCVTEMFRVFERNQTEVLAASVVAGVDRRQLRVTVTAMIGGHGNRIDETLEKIKREILNL